MYDCYGNKSSYQAYHYAYSAMRAASLKERNSAVFNSEMSKSALIFQEAGG